MKKSLLLLILFFVSAYSYSCTNIIVTKGASKDGSCFLFYTCDGEFLYHLKKKTSMNYKKGEFYYFRNYSGDILGKIPQVRHTYATLGTHINEFQVSIGETTFTGREELQNDSKFINYWNLMHLGLERAKTAREAIETMTSIVDKYGYAGPGETFSVVDKNEAWLLEMIGTGENGEGAIWVAVRIPDGMVTVHANKSRIGEFPLNDPENCLYSKNVISFAIEKGYFDPNSGKPFEFNKAYNPSTPGNLRYCSSRVWSVFNRISPSLNLSMDYNRGVLGAKRYPLYVKPDTKLGLKDVFKLVRDHYEGTCIDMTKGYDAGAYGNPIRNRPLLFEADSTQCAWERSISTPNASFSFIAQCRNWLPDEIGGLIWFSDDDSYFSCYQPLYSSITEAPEPYRVGEMKTFSWKSAWWTFNFVSNYANIRYSDMIVDIQYVQDSIENYYINNQSKIEKEALKLYKQKKDTELKRFLTNYCNNETEKLMKRWKELAFLLITKYNDGYIHNSNGYPKTKGYSKEYLKDVLKNRPSVALPNWNKDDNKAKDF